METYVIRLDLEVRAKNDDKAGDAINRVLRLVKRTQQSPSLILGYRFRHFRWALTPTSEGLEDPDLEKMFAQAQYQD